MFKRLRDSIVPRESLQQARELVGLARLPYVHMEMAPARLSAMCMHLVFEFDRYSNKASVTDAALGDYMPSELADVAHRAPQHRYLHATVVIKMDMHRHRPYPAEAASLWSASASCCGDL